MAVRNLNVELCGASGLKNSEYIGKSDPYVILSIGKTERKSKVAQDPATAPSWNEKFTLPVVESDTELVIRILNDNTMAKDDELGRVVIALSEIHGSHSASTFGLQFKGKPQGELKINFSFEGEGDYESEGLVGKIHDLFVGEKKEVHAENKEEEEKESHEEHHKDPGLKEKLKEKFDGLKEKPEEKKEESDKKAEVKREEKAEKKRKIKKVKEKSKESEDEGSSSSTDSESDKESVKEDDIEVQNDIEE